MSDALRAAAANVMRLLASKDYQGLEDLTQGRRLSAPLIENAVKEFGRPVVEPPPEAYERMDIVEVPGAAPRTWSVSMPIWTADLGASDLEAQMTMVADGAKVRVQLDNILVP